MYTKQTFQDLPLQYYTFIQFDPRNDCTGTLVFSEKEGKRFCIEVNRQEHTYSFLFPLPTIKAAPLQEEERLMQETKAAEQELTLIYQRIKWVLLRHPRMRLRLAVGLITFKESSFKQTHLLTSRSEQPFTVASVFALMEEVFPEKNQ